VATVTLLGSPALGGGKATNIDPIVIVRNIIRMHPNDPCNLDPNRLPPLRNDPNTVWIHPVFPYGTIQSFVGDTLPPGWRFFEDEEVVKLYEGLMIK